MATHSERAPFRPRGQIFVLVLLTLAFLLGVGAASYAREPHPMIRKAEKQLLSARATLEHAAHDFGGHRAKAIGDIAAALGELREALNYDQH